MKHILLTLALVGFVIALKGKAVAQEQKPPVKKTAASHTSANAKRHQVKKAGKKAGAKTASATKNLAKPAAKKTTVKAPTSVPSSKSPPDPPALVANPDSLRLYLKMTGYTWTNPSGPGEARLAGLVTVADDGSQLDIEATNHTILLGEQPPGAQSANGKIETKDLGTLLVKIGGENGDIQALWMTKKQLAQLRALQASKPKRQTLGASGG